MPCPCWGPIAFTAIQAVALNPATSGLEVGFRGTEARSCRQYHATCAHSSRVDSAEWLPAPALTVNLKPRVLTTRPTHVFTELGFHHSRQTGNCSDWALNNRNRL